MFKDMCLEEGMASAYVDTHIQKNNEELLLEWVHMNKEDFLRSHSHPSQISKRPLGAHHRFSQASYAAAAKRAN